MAWIQTFAGHVGMAIDLGEKKLGNDVASMVYLLSSTVMSVLMMAWSKVNPNDISAVQTQFFRGLLVTILIFFYSSYKNISLTVATRSEDRLRIIRNLIASLFDVLVFYTITKIPMSTVLMLQTSSPFIIAFMDHFIYKTTYTKTEGLLSLVSVLGVSLVIKPDLFFDVQNLQSDYGYVEGSERIFWIVLFLIGVICWSGSVIMLKALARLNTMALSFPFGICIALSSATMEIQFLQLINCPYRIYFEAVFFVGICSFIDQYGFVKANQIGNPAKLGMLNNMNVVLSFMFEIYYLKEHREWYSFVGAVIIIGSSMALSISRSKQRVKN